MPRKPIALVCSVCLRTHVAGTDSEATMVDNKVDVRQLTVFELTAIDALLYVLPPVEPRLLAGAACSGLACVRCRSSMDRWGVTYLVTLAAASRAARRLADAVAPRRRRKRR